MGSNTIINVVSVRNTLNLGDLLRKPVIHSKTIDYPAHYYIVLMVATTTLLQKFFDPNFRIPKSQELFPGQGSFDVPLRIKHDSRMEEDDCPPC